MQSFESGAFPHGYRENNHAARMSIALIAETPLALVDRQLLTPFGETLSEHRLSSLANSFLAGHLRYLSQLSTSISRFPHRLNGSVGISDEL